MRVSIARGNPRAVMGNRHGARSHPSRRRAEFTPRHSRGAAPQTPRNARLLRMRGIGFVVSSEEKINGQRDQLLLRDLQEIPGGGGQHLRLGPGALRARSLERRRGRLQPARGRRSGRRDGQAVVAGDDVRLHTGLAAAQSQQQRPDAEPALRHAEDLAGADTPARHGDGERPGLAGHAAARPQPEHRPVCQLEGVQHGQPLADPGDGRLDHRGQGRRHAAGGCAQAGDARSLAAQAVRFRQGLGVLSHPVRCQLQRRRRTAAGRWRRAAGARQLRPGAVLEQRADLPDLSAGRGRASGGHERVSPAPAAGRGILRGGGHRQFRQPAGRPTRGQRRQDHGGGRGAGLQLGLGTGDAAVAGAQQPRSHERGLGLRAVSPGAQEATTSWASASTSIRCSPG